MSTDKVLKLFKSELKVVNLGLEIFSKELSDQGVKTFQVAVQPAPKLGKKLADALDKIL